MKNKQTSILLSDDVHKRLKAYCALNGTTITDLLTRLVTEFLSRKDSNKEAN